MVEARALATENWFTFIDKELILPSLSENAVKGVAVAAEAKERECRGQPRSIEAELKHVIS